MFKLLAAAVVLLAVPSFAATPESTAARAEIEARLGFVPEYFKAIPDAVLPGAWEELKTLQASDSTAIPCKVKELIALAVASQVPSKHTIYSHTKLAMLSGATQQEVGEAVAMAALARHWSTFFNGIQLDEAKFKTDVKGMVDGAKKAMSSGMSPPAPLVLTDAKSAYADMTNQMGSVPDFMKKFPEHSVVGAWREMRDVELNPNTKLSGKYKSLIGLAVSAQIPCKYCVFADTEFAKLEGATDAEINEAIAMGAFARHWATLLDGLQVDEASYRRDTDKIVKALSKKGPTTARR